MRNAQSDCVRRIPLLVLCLAPWVAPLPGATLQRLSLDDLIQKSSGIVRAKVAGSYADFWGATIYTHWKLQIVESWKGGGQPTVEVMVPGGSARGFHQSVPGAPQLVAGKEYLLFLWTFEERFDLPHRLGTGGLQLDQKRGRRSDGIARGGRRNHARPRHLAAGQG